MNNDVFSTDSNESVCKYLDSMEVLVVAFLIPSRDPCHADF